MKKPTPKTSAEITLTMPSHITLLQRIPLHANVASAASGVTRRQWDYWVRMRHLIPEETGNNEWQIYSLRTVIKAALMKQALDQGTDSIEEAGSIAENYLVAHENTPPADTESDTDLLAIFSGMQDAIASAEAHVESMRRLRRELYRHA